MIEELYNDDVTETVNAMKLMFSDKITYTIGMRGNNKLEINDEDIKYVFQSTKTTFVKLEINKDDFCIKLYKSENGKDWSEIDSEFEYGTVDLSNNGDRWEGSCLNSNPCGYGKKYDDNNNMVYRGFVFEGKKICFGEEYYDNGIVEYCGTYMNDNRHGHGCLYDRRGELIYEGDWFLNKNELFNVDIPNGCVHGGDMIHNMVHKLNVGDNCCNDMKRLIMYCYPSLSVFTIGRDSFKKLISFELTCCDELTELTIGDETMMYTKSCKLSSMRNLLVLTEVFLSSQNS